MPALPLIGLLLVPSPACTSDPLPGDATVLIRVDGTTLEDWDRSLPLRALLRDGAAANVLLPRSIAEAPRAELSDAGPWYDPGLGGRRVRAAAAAAYASRNGADPADALGSPAERAVSNAGTFVTSSPDARPIAFAGAIVTGSRPDANWPTGARADLDVMREALTTGVGPIEIDIGDVVRLDHERIPLPQRDAFVLDALDHLVAPLVRTAGELGRTVAVVSVLPGLEEQHAERWRGAVAITGIRRGLLSSDRIDPGPAHRGDVGYASHRSLPGTVDISRLLGVLDARSLADDTDPSDTRCRTAIDGEDLPGAAMDRDLRIAAAGHDAAAVALLTFLTVAALLACGLVARARRAPTVRLLVGVVAVAAILLPAVALLEGALGAGIGVRIAVLAVAVASAAALVAWLPISRAVGIAGVIGATAGLMDLGRGGRDVSSSLLAAPLYRGIRGEGPDAFLVAMILVAFLAMVAWWVDAEIPRAPRAIPFTALGVLGAAILGARGFISVPIMVLLGLAAAVPLAALLRSIVPRLIVFGGIGVSFLVFGVLVTGGSATADGLEDLVLLRLDAQPRLWPLLAVLVAILLFVRWRLGRGHGDALARASFGAPTWRVAEVSLYALAPIAAIGLAAGTYAAALLTLLAVLIGRIR